MKSTHQKPIITRFHPMNQSQGISVASVDETAMKHGHNTSAVALDSDLAGIPSAILDLQQRQPTLNLMTCGDVSHGKSTLLYALTGEKTGKHSRELRGNKSIRLGYTSCKIWKCKKCPPLVCYMSTHSDKLHQNIECNTCGADSHNILLIRHISFIDVPGHADLMQTMVSATAVADATLCVIDASKRCPGKQTAQHLEAIHLLGLMHSNQLLIAQNKIDVVSASQACLHHDEIRTYLRSFGDAQLAHNTPIIPISATSKSNIDALCHFIVHHLPKFSKRLESQNNTLYMNIIRSFDVNRSRDLNTARDIDNIAGGVLGGAVLSGHVRCGQVVQVRPGYLFRRPLKKYGDPLLDKLQPRWTAQPIKTTVRSLHYGKRKSETAFAGGNVGMQTDLDPSLTKADRMCGHVVVGTDGLGKAPPIFSHFIMSYSFVASWKKGRGKEALFKQFEQIKVNIGAFRMKAEVIVRGCQALDDARGEYRGVLVILDHPICARVGDEVAVCRHNERDEWVFAAAGIIRCTRSMLIGGEEEPGQQVAASGESADALVKEKKKKQIHIAYQQRTSRKGVTSIVGLPVKLNMKKVMRKMKKKWHTNATLVKDEREGDVIQIQGDLRKEVRQWLLEMDVVPNKSDIMLHGC